MLTVFIATFVIFALVILGMSLGYLVKRKSIQGSCGGISALGLEKVCDCPEPCDARKKRLAREAQRQQRRILCNTRRTCCPAGRRVAATRHKAARARRRWHALLLRFCRPGKARQPPPGIKRLRARRAALAGPAASVL